MADLKIGDEVYIHGFVDEVRRDTVIIKNEGGYFGTVTEEIIPSAHSDLITKIQNGIKVTNADDVYSCGMRNSMRWCMSLIDGKEPLYENCPSAQPEPCEDAVSREEAKWVVFCHRDHVEDQANAIDELPSVRPSAQTQLPEWAQKVEEYRQRAPEYIQNQLAWALYQTLKEYDG